MLDPFCGAGSSLLAGLRHNRKVLGCEKEPEYVEIIQQRVTAFKSGTLGYRPLGKPIHQPTGREKVAQVPSLWQKKED